MPNNKKQKRLRGFSRRYIVLKAKETCHICGEEKNTVACMYNHY